MLKNFMKNTMNPFKLSGVFGLLLAVPFMWACSDGDKTAGTSEEAEGIVAITNREIAGVSQKGPFLVGSSVAIQELDGHTFSQTGNSFRASVKSDQGDFVVKGVNLASQYALLEVSGYYRNEVTGQNSQGIIVLNAVTDLTDRNHVNVNLLTHLSAGRILVLVQNQGMSFADAKKQAEREILASFGITDNMGSAEDLDLFTGRGGAVLLAMSVLMQGDGSEADLSERVAHAAISFADSGSWYGAEKAEMADWALSVDLNFRDKQYDWDSDDLLANVRRYAESWNGGDSIQPFDEFINKFWANEYGLGTCGRENLLEIRPNINVLSRYYKKDFVCDADGRWTTANRRSVLKDRVYDKASGVYYRTVDIGGRTWMAENVRHFSTESSWARFECYGGEESNCEVYGGLYGRSIAQDVCPDGYRLPTYYEVEELLKYYGGSGKEAAQALYAVDGFGALNGGWYNNEGVAEYLHEMALFWISSQSYYGCNNLFLKVDSLGARIDSLLCFHSSVQASIRCIKDDEKKVTPPKKEPNEIIVDVRDQKEYRIVDIGGKTWMAENLCYDSDDCFYSWDKAVGYDSIGGLCPEGWHMPSQQEWNDLLIFTADSSERVNEIATQYYGIDFKLRYVGDWTDGDYVAEPNNPYGFSVTPEGCYDADGNSVHWYVKCAAFWTSSESSASEALGVEMLSRDREENSMGNESVFLVIRNKGNRYSVRCVKD